ncbi:MAG: hypothetical protein WD874_01455 [Parcubacteria group bacterium]
MNRLTLAESGLSKKHFNFLKRLDTPTKVQDFLNKIPFNHERRKETYRGVEKTLNAGEAHCFEGALLGAAAFWIKGRKPLLMDLRTTDEDVDHVVALFNINGFWGAVGKTNHGVLRYREPIYKNPRELALSYFHEYFLNDGTKTLRKFSKPFDLLKVKINWLTSKEDLWELTEMLDKSAHEDLLTPFQIRNLRKADKIERKMGEIVDYK